MKKFFLFAAAVVAAMTVNAEVYSLGGIQADQVTLNAAGAKSTYTFNQGKENEQVVPAVDYVSKEGDILEASIADIPNFKFQYKNGGLNPETGEMKDGSKKGILIFAEKYFQAGGKNVIMMFSGLQMDDEIILHVAAKGDTNAEFTVEGATADPANPASVGKATKDAENHDVYTVLKFYANGADVTIKEVKNGFRITDFEIVSEGGNQAVENVAAEVKAVKTFKNGQIVIEKAGRTYNVLGAEVVR